jgi:hypothetical protein
VQLKITLVVIFKPPIHYITQNLQKNYLPACIHVTPKRMTGAYLRALCYFSPLSACMLNSSSLHTCMFSVALQMTIPVVIYCIKPVVCLLCDVSDVFSTIVYQTLILSSWRQLFFVGNLEPSTRRYISVILYNEYFKTFWLRNKVIGQANIYLLTCHGHTQSCL